MRIIILVVLLLGTACARDFDRDMFSGVFRPTSLSENDEVLVAKYYETVKEYDLAAARFDSIFGKIRSLRLPQDENSISLCAIGEYELKILSGLVKKSMYVIFDVQFLLKHASRRTRENIEEALAWKIKKVLYRVHVAKIYRDQVEDHNQGVWLSPDGQAVPPKCGGA